MLQGGARQLSRAITRIARTHIWLPGFSRLPWFTWLPGLTWIPGFTLWCKGGSDTCPEQSSGWSPPSMGHKAHSPGKPFKKAQLRILWGEKLLKAQKQIWQMQFRKSVDWTFTSFVKPSTVGARRRQPSTSLHCNSYSDWNSDMSQIHTKTDAKSTKKPTHPSHKPIHQSIHSYLPGSLGTHISPGCPESEASSCLNVLTKVSCCAVGCAQNTNATASRIMKYFLW